MLFYWISKRWSWHVSHPSCQLSTAVIWRSSPFWPKERAKCSSALIFVMSEIYFFPAVQATFHILQFIILINSYSNQITLIRTRFSFIYWGVTYFVYPDFVRTGLFCRISDLRCHKITAPTMNSGYGLRNFIF